MDPNMMSSMMSMLNNPQMMDQMKEMMNNPQMQEMLNNPELMKNVMGMFGAPPANFTDAFNPNSQENVGADDTTDVNANTDSETKLLEETQETNENKFSDNDKIILINLKTEEYNGKEVKVITFNEEKQRYVVEIEGGKQLLVKEENLSLEDEEDLIEIN